MVHVVALVGALAHASGSVSDTHFVYIAIITLIAIVVTRR